MTSFPNQQNLQAGAIPVYIAGSNYENVTASQLTQVSSSPGSLDALSINAAGTGSAAAFYDGLSSVVTITIAVPGVVSWPKHGLAAGAAVRFTTTGALPTGLSVGTVYYVSTVGLAAGAFSLADTKAHALAGTNTITTTGTQSGVHTGWNVTNLIGTFATTAVNFIRIGAATTLGLIMITTDGGGAAGLTVLYR